VQDEWVVCRIFQKSSGGKRSFLFSDARLRQAMGSYQLEDAFRSSLPPAAAMMDNSPNPTVTTDEGTDCETCAGTEQMSCYNCVPDFHHESPQQHNKEFVQNGIMSWVAHPENHNNHNNSNNSNNIHGGLNTMLSKSYPMFESSMSMNMSRFNNQQAFNPASNFRFRPKTEPASCEDEAQSAQKMVFDYSGWPGEVTSLYNNESSNTGDLSSLTGNLCSSGENVHLFNFKYRLSDVTAPVVDASLGHEILWAC